MMPLLFLFSLAALLLIVFYVWYRYTKEHERLMTLQDELSVKSKELLHDQLVLKDAERTMQMKRRFMDNVSHELRTPLNALSGFTQILLSGDHDLSVEEEKQIGGLILENITLLTSIVDKMMQQSHYDSIEEIACNDVVVLNDFYREITDSYQGKLHKGVELRFTSRLNEKEKILTNRKCMERLLVHLLDNAVYHTQEGNISVGLLLHPVSKNLVLWVSDTGPGIRPERRQEVFELFCETGEQVKTMGMGLSICRSICRLLGGIIYIDPDYTGGTRVIVELPFTEPKNDLD